MSSPITSVFGSSTAMTITLASLATSTAGVGRQSTMVDNSSTLAQMVRIYFKVATGTSPTASKTIQFFLLSGDDPSSSNIRTDGSSATDAGLTVVTAPMVYVVQTTSTSNQSYQGSFLIRNPGKEWGIAIVHDTGVNLNSTGGNHSLRYVTENQQI